MKDNLVIGGQLVNYYQIGQGKKNLIFLHGWGSNALIWQNIISKIDQKQFCIYTLDLPGFGNSALPKKSFSISDYTEVISEFISKLNLKNNILIGHSFGGRIAIKLAATHPNLIKKLILVDSAGIKVDKKFTNYLAKIVKPIFKPKFMQKSRMLIYKKIGAQDYANSGELKETFKKIINEDLTSYLDRIKLPVLIIWGEDDQETPLQFAQIMKEKINNSQLKIIKDAGHFSFIDQPQLFINELNNFIT